MALWLKITNTGARVRLQDSLGRLMRWCLQQVSRRCFRVGENPSWVIVNSPHASLWHAPCLCFRFLLAGRRAAEVETPDTVPRATKVQSLTPVTAIYCLHTRLFNDDIVFLRSSQVHSFLPEWKALFHAAISADGCHCYAWYSWGLSWIFMYFSAWERQRCPPTAQRTFVLYVQSWRPHAAGHRRSPVQTAETSHYAI